MEQFKQCLAVGGGGFIGAIARYLLGTLCGSFFGTAFPVGTLLINLSGSLFLGWFMTVTDERMIVSENFRMAIAVGFVGAYTTFSTFMFESNALVIDGSQIKAIVNLLGSLILGLMLVRAGIWLGRH